MSRATTTVSQLLHAVESRPGFPARENRELLPVPVLHACASPEETEHRARALTGQSQHLRAVEGADAHAFLRRVGDHGGLEEADVPPVGLVLRHFADLIAMPADRKSTRLNSSHSQISYAVF